MEMVAADILDLRRKNAGPGPGAIACQESQGEWKGVPLGAAQFLSLKPSSPMRGTKITPIFLSAKKPFFLVTRYSSW